MANGELDKVGCEYGRATRCLLEDFRRYCATATAKTEERLKAGADKFHELESAIKELTEKVTSMQTKQAWMLGFAAAIGAMFGTLLSAILKHLL